MSEMLLELIALELTLARTRSAVPPTNYHKSLSEILEQDILIRQADLNILPIKQTAERLGIEVKFFYEDELTNTNHTPSPETKTELDRLVWQDPELAENIVEARKRVDAGNGQGIVAALRKLPANRIGLPSRASHYKKPEYRLW